MIKQPFSSPISQHANRYQTPLHCLFSRRSLHTSKVTLAPTRLPYNTKPTVPQSIPSPKQSNQSNEQAIDISRLPEIYSYDRSKTWRIITVGSVVVLIVAWLPLTYLSLTTDTLPLWQTILGPITTVAMIAAVHYKAKRTIGALHFLDSNRFVVTVHNGLGQPRSFPMKYIETELAGQPALKTRKVDGPLWILKLRGHEGFFVLDKKGKLSDLNSMRRLVGDDDVFHNQ